MAVLPVKETDISTKWITKTSVNSVLCRQHTRFDLKKKKKPKQTKKQTPDKNQNAGKQKKHSGVTVNMLSLKDAASQYLWTLVTWFFIFAPEHEM